MNGFKAMRLPQVIFFFCLMVALVVMANAETAPAPDAKAPPAKVQDAPPAKAVPASTGMLGKGTCLSCHDNYMKDTVHGRLNPKYPRLEKIECEACHGAGEAHVSAGGDKTLINGKPATKTIKDNCLACHPQDKALASAWHRDAHFENPEMSCLSCHTIHVKKEFAQLKKPQVELCLSCHKDIGAEFKRAFHHPLGEGQHECSSCHNPHQNDRRSGRPASKNDMCTKCHTQVKGPFMYEHKAMTEDGGCLNCHQPHGGSSRKLLKQADNQMCIQCHQADLVLPNYLTKDTWANRDSRATLEHSRLPALQGKCVNCHTAKFTPLVGNHFDKVTNSECALCHTQMKGIDHTRFVSQGRCIDCHTDVHGSNHSRAFLD